MSKRVGASEFDDAQGYRGDNLNDGIPTYAELSLDPAKRDFKALGGLEYHHPLKVTLPRTGKSVVAYKRDVGAGGGKVPGPKGNRYVRRIDLHTEVAKTLGFNGLEVVEIEDVENAPKPNPPRKGRPKAYKPTKAEVERLQRAINKFLKKRAVPLAPLIVDGSYGPLTERYVVSARFFLGYVDEYRHRRPDQGLLDALAKPRSLGAKAWTRGLGRRRAARARHAASNLKSQLVTGVTTFDGVRVAKVAVPILQWCREHGWNGKLVSGYRTPAYSEHLCYVRCGAPSCPGTCAGRSTNHAYAQPDRFAVDVSDYDTFRQVVAKCPLKPRIFNDLPNDRVHFSPTGR